MASIKPYRYKKGWWRVQINRRGVRDSEVFPSKGRALAWAAERESEIMAGVRGEIPNLTVKALLDRYAREVSAGKKGERWEVVRLEALGRDRIAQVPLRRLDAPHVSDWQQRRLEAVSSASVRRERNLLNAVFEVARKEWRWLKRNPFEGVRRPRDGRPRDRVATEGELSLLLKTASSGLRRVVVFALETGMRAGEIGRLRSIDVNGRIATIVDGKTGGRQVPLSDEALRAATDGCRPTGLDNSGDRNIQSAHLFMRPASISALFAKLCKEVGIKGLTFHDLRRTAIVRLSKKLDPFELAKMVGHKDLRMTLNTYYKADLEKIAEKL